MPLNPINHITAIAGSQCNGIICIDIRHVVLDILKSVDEIIVGSSSPFIGNAINEILTITSASCRVWSDDDVSLLCKYRWIPSRAPTLAPSALWTTME